MLVYLDNLRGIGVDNFPEMCRTQAANIEILLVKEKLGPQQALHVSDND